MKKIKRMMAIAIAIILSLGVSNFVFADVPTAQTIANPSTPDETTGKYTISVANTDNHTYTAYQILKGTLVPGESKLGNPTWGSDAKKTGSEGVQAFITNITANNLTNVQIDDLVKAELKDGASGAGTITKTNPLDVEPGYYLIVDTTATENLADGDAKSLNIVAVFNDITITPKKGTTTSEKHVDDQNDSDSTDHSKLQDSADYDIGDTIPYTLTATLPEDYANYKKYYISFTDDMSAGLTYNGDAKIYFGANDTTGASITFTAGGTSSYSGGTVYTYTIEDLKTGTEAQKALTAGSVIKITYTATLNEKAVIASTGNPNKYKIDFSSNPNETGTGKPETNDTPWDINIVFTYKTVFNKVDKDQKPLTGADFVLYKFVESDGGSDTHDSKKGTWTDVTALNTVSNPTKVIEKLTNSKGTADNAKFTFSGLDAGDYRLVETTTPTGYNTIDPIEFTITATHDLASDDPKLTALSGADGAEFTMTAVKDSNNNVTGELDADIKNLQGAELPSTGGSGTTMIYIIGVILLAGAGILLVTRRRMKAE